MLSNMFIVAVAALGSLRGVSAQEYLSFKASSGDLVGRVPQHKLGDTCYPEGKGFYEVPSFNDDAACMMEQLISKGCEEKSGALNMANMDPLKWTKYWDCINGSSYYTEVQECLKCKRDSGMFTIDVVTWWKTTWDSVPVKVKNLAETLQQTTWDIFNSVADWSQLTVPKTQHFTEKMITGPREHKLGPFKVETSSKQKRDSTQNGAVTSKIVETDGVTLEITEVDGHLINGEPVMEW
ncbi:hypothetical protein CDD80_2136 [Ophiocordyceps camponoti-rufipedis]|uniref:Ecp2 effector protein domain-containing protein n=1 Tax=Ophiocordyceps camponoti-rufipedis TaxID=2004952 RepID=A0A2C5ZEF9_9HYPO|nr:hypothetical protein CDD80_2136 [Ophiocordyceps camponoti-rufipedis]